MNREVAKAAEGRKEEGRGVRLKAKMMKNL
jgi:hypothetical protein